MVICSKSGKPTYRAIFANTSLDARTEKRSVITVLPLYSQLTHLRRTLISLILSVSWIQSVRIPCCLARTNRQAAPNAGTKNPKLKAALGFVSWRQHRQEAPWRHWGQKPVETQN